MPKGDAKSNSALGFLTVVEDPQHGLFGGYLVLNMAGRPLEFHCTAPIKPNRAQQILYGPTLQPYLFGEQIGQTLLTKGTIEPRVVCTDQEPVLAVRDFVRVPVVLVLPSEDRPPHAQMIGDGDSAVGSEESGAERSSISNHPSSIINDHWIAFRLGRNRLAVPHAGVDDPGLITDRLGELSDSFDLAEPFQRIREAIEEARRGGR